MQTGNVRARCEHQRMVLPPDDATRARVETFANADPFTVTISVERVSAEPEPREFRAEARWGDDVLASAQASDAVAAYRGAAAAAAQVLSRSNWRADLVDARRVPGHHRLVSPAW